MGSRVLRAIIVPGLVLVASALPAYADEPIAIGTVLRDAESYALHSVLLKGKVRDAQVVAPFLPPGEGCRKPHVAVAFNLDDETGSIQVGAHLCGNQSIKSIKNGDRVLIRAVILVAHEYIEGEDRRTVAAMLQGMQPLGD
jgi:hypothetical protein